MSTAATLGEPVLVRRPSALSRVGAFFRNAVVWIVLILVLLCGLVGWYIISLHNQLDSKSSHIQQMFAYTVNIDRQLDERDKELREYVTRMKQLEVEDDKDFVELEKLVTNLENAKNALVTLRDEFKKLLATSELNLQQTKALEAKVAKLEVSIHYMSTQLIPSLRNQAATALSRARAAEAATQPFWKRLFGG